MILVRTVSIRDSGDFFLMVVGALFMYSVFIGALLYVSLVGLAVVIIAAYRLLENRTKEVTAILSGVVCCAVGGSAAVMLAQTMVEQCYSTDPAGGQGYYESMENEAASDGGLAIDEILQHRLDTTIPRCLDLVNVKRMSNLERSSDLPGFWVSTFTVSAKNQDFDVARILGYTLSELKPLYEGSAFMSPISLQWPDDTVVPLFDSQIDGYHGERDAAGKIRGSGEPKAYACPHCDARTFEVVVKFDYAGGCCDLMEDKPDLEIENYFTGISISGKCHDCGRMSNAVAMCL